MQEIDVLIDEQTDLAKEMALLDIRNQAAHTELKYFNDTGKFIYISDITRSRKTENDQITQLTKLKETDINAFMNEVTNVMQNIRRIESQIRNKKYKTNEELQSWEDNLTRAKLRREAIQSLLK